MMDELLSIAICSCHEWIVSPIDRIGHCKRCKEVPVVVRPATPDDKTICLHDGPCLEENNA